MAAAARSRYHPVPVMRPQSRRNHSQGRRGWLLRLLLCGAGLRRGRGYWSHIQNRVPYFGILANIERAEGIGFDRPPLSRGGGRGYAPDPIEEIGKRKTEKSAAFPAFFFPGASPT